MDFVGAFLGGLAARAIYHPFETSRANLQLKSTGPRSTIYLTYKLIRDNGLLYLYNGLGLSILASAVGTGVYFATYNAVYSKFETKNYTTSVASAVTAEAVCNLVYVPSLIGTGRIQVKSSINEYKVVNAFKILSNIIKAGEHKTLFKGYWITMASFLPLSIIQMPLYEVFNSFIYTIYDKLGGYFDNELKKKLIASCLSASFAWWISSPIDIIRFRLHIQNPETDFKYKGLIHVW